MAAPYDLAVVGAGPAGASAARAAAARGLSVLLLDKEPFPREKPCGGAISARGIHYLGASIPPQLVEGTVDRARIRYRDITTDSSSTEPVVWIVDRARFDAYLLEEATSAGAVTRVARVREVSGGPATVALRTDAGVFHSRYAVVAEGAFGGLKGAVRRKDRPEEMGLCAVTWSPADEQLRSVYPHSAIEVHFGLAGYGYGWVFPHRDRFSVGVGGRADRFTSPRSRLEDFLRESGHDPALARGARIHPIPAGGIDRPVGSGRVLLAGDAAGFVDAFLGEGISFAIRSGQNAAHAVAAALDGTSVAAPSYYRSLCETDFGRHLRDSLFLARMLHAHPGVLLKGFISDRRLLDAFTEVPTMQTTYRAYIRRAAAAVPRILLRELGAAIRRPATST
jgi:geranylgeranyl reductase family protein